MRFPIISLLLALNLGAIAPVNAGFEEGLAAIRAGDRKTAFLEFRDAAEAGDSRAFGKLAASYLYGAGTERNLVQAFVWFKLALDSGDAEAERFLDAVAAEMTEAQLKEAEKMAADLSVRYKEPVSEETNK